MQIVTPSLMKQIRSQFVLDWHGPHGASHWARVYAHGQAIGAMVGADLRVCELFAFLHDARRLDEDVDRDHGARASEYAAWLRKREYFELEDHAFSLLQEACARHSEGRVDGNLTVQVCWDSDRLDLARVGIEPKPKYLCTSVAKHPARIAEAIAWSEQWVSSRLAVDLDNGSG